MMENQPPLTSPGGSTDRNTPERCPRPLYSRDSTQEDVLQSCQVDGVTVIKVEDDEMFMSGDEENEIPPEISTDPGGTRAAHIDVSVEKEGHVKIKDEELSITINTVGSNNRNTPEKCPHPLYSQDSTQEDQEIPQDEDMIKVLIKEEAEETDMSSDELCEEQEISPEISTDGQYQRDKSTLCSKNDKTDEAKDNHIASDHPSKDNPVNPNSHTKCLPDQSLKMFPCSECGKSFTSRGKLIVHQRSHPDEKLFSCLECGKTFRQKSKFAKHQRYHRSQKALPCPECGKCFTQKSLLEIHERVHTGEKPFSCSECGKRFSQSGSLIAHQRIHTSVRPYVCSECGKCFTQRQQLTLHQRTHTAEKPFSCTECGRSFSQRVTLMLHQRTHTGERPFSCSECGKSFTKRPSLVAHQIIHLSDRPFSCSECGKSFTRKGSLTTHQRSHTGEKPFSCSACGKRFTRKTSLKSHMSFHRGQEVLGSACGS